MLLYHFTTTSFLLSFYALQLKSLNWSTCSLLSPPVVQVKFQLSSWKAPPNLSAFSSHYCLIPHCNGVSSLLLGSNPKYLLFPKPRPHQYLQLTIAQYLSPNCFKAPWRACFQHPHWHLFRSPLDIWLPICFLPKRSTTGALLYATHSISSLLDKHVPVCGIFLDLKKAFDSVPYQPLLNRLSNLPIPLFLVNWIHSYLANRSQSVHINGFSSNSAPVTSGVPQGWILGPLLFLLYMDSICQSSLSHCSKLIVYADDILLLHPVSCHNDFLSAQCDLDCIVSNIMSIHLVINPTKSKFMLFSSCPNSLPSYPTLTISGTPIEQVQSFHYLGLSFTPKLSWSDHITAIAQKACCLVGHLYRQFYKSCSSLTLLSLYFSIIRPVLEYSSVVWDPSSATHSSNLESVQYFALKVISKLWSSSYASLL